MEGPKAPKDPEKKLPGFYIVREKEIFGTEQPDKRGGHFLYENDGRLINSAQISGNITDERILEALKTAEGFRNLVKCIGICVEAGRACKELEFVFQMYGKKNRLHLTEFTRGIWRRKSSADRLWISSDASEPMKI